MSPTDGFIIILGSPNSDEGKLYYPAIERCILALSEYKKKKNYKFLLTGGFGEHFNKSSKPHASYLKSFIIGKGISEKDVVEFAESRNTLEDASLSKEIVLKYKVKKILVITSDYHYERAKLVFEREFSDVDIKIDLSVSITNVQKCEFNLEPIIDHEINSIKRLKNNNKSKFE